MCTTGEEDEGDHQQEEEGDQHQEDEEREDKEGGEEEEGEAAIPAIWQRGPLRVPERPILLERRPIIRPDGKR